jgi:thiol:disulfide interchange protein DsbD
VGNTNPLKPLQGINSATATIKEASIKFERIHSIEQLEQRLKQASEQHKTVMLDFYADWCISCKEMESYTFTDNNVKQALSNFILLQADVTANNAEDKALLARFNLIGPPAILFFNNTKEQSNQRVIGYQDASQFLNSLARVSHD